MKSIVVGLVFLALMGCSQLGRKKAFVTVEMANVSGNYLNWVKLNDGDRQLLSEGILIPTARGIHLDYLWSKMPEEAKLTFIDDQTRQSYSINVSLKDANARVLSDHCKRVVIRILSYDKVEVVCK